VEEVCSRLGGGFYMNTRVINIPKGSGLGTSSILAGACVKGLYRFMGRPISDNDLYNRVLCMEQIMSTGGGWQDQVGGLAPGIKMLTADPGLQQKILCTPVRIADSVRAELNARFALIYTGQRRLARNLLRDIVGKYIGNDPDAVQVLYRIQQVAVLMRFELEKGNIDGFAELLNEHWELSKKLDAGCTNTCIDQIFLSVEDLIDGRMICGAGGGGFVQVIMKKGVTRETLQDRLDEVFANSGVGCMECGDFVTIINIS
jgi:fucokinase